MNSYFSTLFCVIAAPVLISCPLAGSNDGAWQRCLLGRSLERKVVMEWVGGAQILGSLLFAVLFGCRQLEVPLEKSHDSGLFL